MFCCPLSCSGLGQLFCPALLFNSSSFYFNKVKKEYYLFTKLWLNARWLIIFNFQCLFLLSLLIKIHHLVTNEFISVEISSTRRIQKECPGSGTAGKRQWFAKIIEKLVLEFLELLKKYLDTSQFIPSVKLFPSLYYQLYCVLQSLLSLLKVWLSFLSLRNVTSRKKMIQ